MLSASLLFAVASSASEPALVLAKPGRPTSPILLGPGATEVEKFAASELADHLGRITGGTWQIQVRESLPEGPCVVVGPGPLAEAATPNNRRTQFGPEEAWRFCDGKRLVLAGGRPRGTLYAVYRFLSEDLGVRWWAPWATDLPTKKTLSIQAMNVKEEPAFEYREPFWHCAFDGDWAARNLATSSSARLEDRHGGKVVYEGFVHTFFGFIPPSRFQEHPEWFSMINGKRVDNQQLCTTNPEVRRIIVEEVKKRLRANPNATIASVSQNDTFGPCECPNCKAIDDREGSHAGTMVELANFVAEAIKTEFPHVAIDTLAYQYTRKPNRSLKPNSNVIVRLCSIECNFAKPLEHASNQAFADDIRGWSKLSQRLYVWDYVTNFSHYFAPHPNWFSLGPNVRFFHKHGVRGLFEQGSYNTSGAEMGEMRAWVLARLLWDPYQDDRNLINEFLDGYYGKAAAKPIRRYLKLVSDKAEVATCFSGLASNYLDFKTMFEAEKLWMEAEKAVAGDPEKLWRVRLAHQPIRYVFLRRWTQFQIESQRANVKWPLDSSRRKVAQEFISFLTNAGPEGWEPVNRLTEWGVTPDEFLKQMEHDPVMPVLKPETANTLPPSLANKKGVVVLQEDRADLVRDGDWVWAEGDPLASNGVCLKMPATHREWAANFRLSNLPKKVQSGKWTAYLEVRCDTDPLSSVNAFTCGVYDNGAAKSLANAEGSGSKDAYHLVKIGTFEATPSCGIWFAPNPGQHVTAIYVDRVLLVPED